MLGARPPHGAPRGLPLYLDQPLPQLGYGRSPAKKKSLCHSFYSHSMQRLLSRPDQSIRIIMYGLLLGDRTMRLHREELHSVNSAHMHCYRMRSFLMRLCNSASPITALLDTSLYLPTRLTVISYSYLFAGGGQGSHCCSAVWSSGWGRLTC